MSQCGSFIRLIFWIVLSGFSGHISTVGAHADLTVSGVVVDHNGNAVDRAIVTIALSSDHGPDFSTVFSDENGAFSTGAVVSVDIPGHVPVTARKLGYKQIHQSMHPGSNGRSVGVGLIMRPVLNQAEVAPASAWLSRVEPGKRAHLIHTCAGCHQIPGPNVRRFADLIDDNIAGLPGVEPRDVRHQSWAMIEQYMNILMAESLFQLNGVSFLQATQLEASIPSADGNTSAVAGILAEYFVGPMSNLVGYDYGAPILATPQTMISEYRLRDVDSIHGAVLLGSPPKLWTAATGRHNGLIRLDPNTGERRQFDTPVVDGQKMKPNGLQRGADETLWITSSIAGAVARFDTRAEKWLGVWQLKDEGGAALGVAELSLGKSHEVQEDKLGRIWFSDNSGSALGYFVPENGSTRLFPVPHAPEHPYISGPNIGLGGLVMSSNQQFVWYSQPGRGVIGSIDTENFQFGTVVLQQRQATPGRVAVGDGDALYVPLLGTGQLLQYNTSSGEQTIHDLPDRSSSPSTATFDPIRKAVWITTVNGDSIYRFDTSTRESSLLPLPRQGSYLQRVSLDGETGMLAGVYLSGSDQEKRMPVALTIEVGDGAYPEQTVDTNEERGDAQ